MEKTPEPAPNTSTEAQPPTTRRRRRPKKRRGTRANPYAAIRKHVMVQRRNYNKALRKYDGYLSKRDTHLERLVKLAARVGKYERKRNHMFQTIVGGSSKERVKEILALKLKAQTKSERHLKHKFEEELRKIKRLHDETRHWDMKVTEAIANLERSCVVMTSGGFANLHNMAELGIERRR